MYSMYSKYYDRLNTSHEPWFSLIDQHTAHLGPGCSMIDYGCGTGNDLFHYRNRFQPFGVDISAPVLKQAIARMPSGHFVLGDMVTFKSESPHDVSLCLFDATNHVLDQRNWAAFFRNVAASTAPVGGFILDLNTTARLETLAKRPPMVQEFDNNSVWVDRRTAGWGVRPRFRGVVGSPPGLYRAATQLYAMLSQWRQAQ